MSRTAPPTQRRCTRNNSWRSSAPAGHLDKLLGHSSVEVRRQIGNAAPQVLSANELVATFGGHGDWETLDQRGNVRFQQGDRRASADHANIVRANDTITLDGSPVISDSLSRTTAAYVTVNQKSGDLRATGGVVSTYIPTAKGDALSIGTGTAHISADSFSGTVRSNHVVVTYAGHARLWQGESVLDSDQIEVWQDDKKLQASGHVVAVFSQVSGPLTALPDKSKATTAGPTLWKITAPTLTYWSDQGKAHLEGGVYADSNQGSLVSRTLDLFLTPATPPGTCRCAPPAAVKAPRQPPWADASLKGPWLRVRSSSGRETAGPWPSRRNIPPRTENSSFPAAIPRLLMLPATQPRAIR